MPTNFTVVPVEARADGDQDEAAELSEAPGAPEGPEPDSSSPGERSRTCPRDKGGAGLLRDGGGSWREGGRRKGCGAALPPLYPLSRGLPQFLSLRLLLRFPHPRPAPLLLAESPTKLSRGTPDEGSRPCPALLGL